MFKPGDKIRRINVPFGNIKVGDICKVVKQTDTGITIEGSSIEYIPRNFELANSWKDIIEDKNLDPIEPIAL